MTSKLNPRPWMDVDPEPLPEEDAALLAVVVKYAETAQSAENRVDSLGLTAAAALNALYARTDLWAEEWNRVRPPKPDAIGRPVDPTSRNRFSQWLAWRAEKSSVPAVRQPHVYRLLHASTSADYFLPGERTRTTVKGLAPLSWMLTHGYADRIPEVRQIILAAAGDGPITEKITRKALSEWKAKNLTRKDIDRGKAVARSRPIRKRAEDDFDELMRTNPEDARDFIKWAAERLLASAERKSA